MSVAIPALSDDLSTDSRRQRWGLLGGGTFVAVTTALTFVQHGHYSAARQAISELALGQGGFLMLPAFLGLGLSIAVVAWRLWQLLGLRTAPVVLALAAVGAGPLSGFFHTDPAGVSTWHGRIHDSTGIVTFVLLIVSIWAASGGTLRAAARSGRPSDRRLVGLHAVFGLLATGTFLLVPVLGQEHFGIAQRLFVGTVVAWVLTTTAVLGTQHQE